MKHYVLLVEGDTEPSLKGPYDEPFVRDDHARMLKAEYRDESGIYWLNQEDDGTLDTGAYSGAFFRYPLWRNLVQRLSYWRGTRYGSYLKALYEDAEKYRVGTLMDDPDCIFVFGSNLAGRHGAGAARIALKEYGAARGVGLGLAGDSWALPTKDANLDTLSLPEITAQVDNFLTSVSPHRGYAVTRVGCGLAGLEDEDMAPLFKGAPENVHLPIGWREFNGESEHPEWACYKEEE